MRDQSVENIIFDLGGVLVDWDPKYLYNKVFNYDQEKLNWFLENICTSDWNVEQDAGRSLAEATNLLIEKHPEQELYIRMFYDRWEEMLKGEIQGTVEILEQIKQKNQKQLYALTNWSAETFPIALERFDFLGFFKGIVVSGTEKTRKPFDDIYQILLHRYNLTASSSLFIDDNRENVEAARRNGLIGIHFQDPNQLRSELEKLGILI